MAGMFMGRVGLFAGRGLAARPAPAMRRVGWWVLRPVLGEGGLRYNPRLSPPAALDGRLRIYFRSKRLDPWH